MSSALQSCVIKSSNYAGIFADGATTPDTNVAGKQACDAFALTSWNGAVLQFVDNATVGNIASDSGAKGFYKFARPCRWSAADSSLPQVKVLPDLLVRRAAGGTAAAAQTSVQQDSDFPSGHTAEFVRYSDGHRLRGTAALPRSDGAWTGGR